MPLEAPFPTTPFAWHRVTFRAKAPAGAMIAAMSLDAAGKPLDADHHTGVDPSDDWTEQVFCTRAKAGAAHALIRVNPPSLADCVRDVAVEPVDRPAVAAWADALWSTMPPLPWEPPPDRWRRLPRLASSLQARGTRDTARVVMLGDSIVNDTGNSPWEVLVERHYPGLRIEVVTSVRGGTGCWFYQHESRVKPYVLDHQPDVLVIGGISHNSDTEAIRSVIRQVRCGTVGGASAPRVFADPTRGRDAPPTGSAPDILLMTGAFGKDRDPRALPDWSPAIVPGDGGYRSSLAALAADEGCGFLDLEGASGAYLLSTDHPYAWFMRDPAHANARGGQLLARILERYFAPKGVLPKPYSGDQPRSESRL